MERDRDHPLGGFVELDDAYLGGERSGGKRGRGAPGKTPFVAAVETNDEGHPLRVKLTVVEGFRLTDRRLGTAAPEHRHSGALRWAGLLRWRDRCGLCTSADSDRRREGRGRASRVSLGEHDLGNVKNALRGTYHAVRPNPALSGVRVPVQSSIRPARSARTPPMPERLLIELSLSGNQDFLRASTISGLLRTLRSSCCHRSNCRRMASRWPELRFSTLSMIAGAVPL